MLIQINSLKMPIDYTADDLRSAICKKIDVKSPALNSFRIIRRSVDARKKNDISFVFSVEANVSGKIRFSNTILPCEPQPKPITGKFSLIQRPIVVGAGPAGLFAALTLAEAGTAPILIERGKPVEERKLDVFSYHSGGMLDINSNIQFGEGGAGTFSDGKLNTGIKDPRCRLVLKMFADAGAPENILWDAKPHIGTDHLPQVVATLRERIIALGGTVLFRTTLTGYRSINGKLFSVFISGPEGCSELQTDTLILAIGHSARDTFHMLRDNGIPMEAKPFSVGARIEHLQKDIDVCQYGRFAGHPALGAADYKLSTHLSNGRGVYSFCMCPGGTVVAAASEPDTIVTNGMSVYARNGENANAAILVSVSPEDFPSRDPLAGIAFQRKIEHAAFCGDARAPAQLVGDLLDGQPSLHLRSVHPSYLPGVRLGTLECCLPDFVLRSMQDGIRLFGSQLRTFQMPDAVLTGPETRSSSPVRILRASDCQSIGLQGLYPCGEGAGYAGGITSAAVDGIRCAEALLTTYGKRIC